MGRERARGRGREATKNIDSLKKKRHLQKSPSEINERGGFLTKSVLILLNVYEHLEHKY